MRIEATCYLVREWCVIHCWRHIRLLAIHTHPHMSKYLPPPTPPTVGATLRATHEHVDGWHRGLAVRSVRLARITTERPALPKRSGVYDRALTSSSPPTRTLARTS